MSGEYEAHSQAGGGSVPAQAEDLPSAQIRPKPKEINI